MAIWTIQSNASTWQEAMSPLVENLYHYFHKVFRNQREQEELTQVAVCSAVHLFRKKYAPGKRFLIFSSQLFQSAVLNHPGITGVGRGAYARGKEQAAGDLIALVQDRSKYKKEEELDFKLGIARLAPQEAKAIHLRLSGVGNEEAYTRAHITRRRYRRAAVRLLISINPETPAAELLEQCSRD